MKTQILDALKHGRLYFDGGTGTVLQSLGLAPGEAPEEWSITHPDKVYALHRSYLEAGADIIKTNTFGVNRLRYDDPEKYIKAATDCARKAVSEFEGKWIALDIGPLGRLLEPLGNLPFEEAVSIFAEIASLAEKHGADIILIETMNDSYETKAAVLAAKENSSLPIFVTNVYDEGGKLMTGADCHAMAALLEGLGADAIGMNCSLGPDKLIKTVKELLSRTSLPVIVNPNAGLPTVRDGKTCFDIDAEEFSSLMVEIAKLGASVLGGCCGTTPEYIARVIEKTHSLPYSLPERKHITTVSSYTHAVDFGSKPILIGERINPTGKKKIKEALRSGSYEHILSEGVHQVDCGVHMLDVNAGIPEIDEAAALEALVKQLQSITDVPLQLDTANSDALCAAMRSYNGKPLVNSVNGSRESMEKVFPLVKKYGGAVIALTMDESGIPATAEGRQSIARKIVTEAEKYGIDKCDIIVDPLALAASSEPKSALVTLEAIRLISQDPGVCTSLGVSNISFGLPCRDAINSSFFACALNAGLSAAIMNPFSEDMMKAYFAHNALSGLDSGFAEYIAFASSLSEKEALSGKAGNNNALASNPSIAANSVEMTLRHAVEKGLSDSAKSLAEKLLQSVPPMEIINGEIIPALGKVGDAFEKKTVFLPQLLMCAEAASVAFDIIKNAMPPKAEGEAEDRKIILATVKGDIHDIGKNIVKALLENFGFDVIDLGRDTEPQLVADTAKKHNCRLVGLSALMTTTVPSMEKTIRLVKEASPSSKIVVGGAVLTKEYADMIGADFYAADAMETVRTAQKIFSDK